MEKKLVSKWKKLLLMGNPEKLYRYLNRGGIDAYM